MENEKELELAEEVQEQIQTPKPRRAPLKKSLLQKHL